MGVTKYGGRGRLFKFLLLGSLSLLLSPGVKGSATDRFDSLSGASHPYESWSAPPPAPSSGGGWGGGTKGSYYHYHVPLVGNGGGGGGGWGGSGWGWAAEGGKGGHDVIIWVLVGLLLLGLLASLLLPLLLIPLGLSLLALLLGGMMMMAGGGMMMMMMMMMMPSSPQPASRTELVGRAVETMSKMVAGDTEGAISHLLSSLELESYCPEKAVCNLGVSLSSTSSSSLLPLGLETTPLLAKLSGWRKEGWLGLGSGFLPAAISSHPRGRRLVKRMEKAFWLGLLHEGGNGVDGAATPTTGGDPCARLEKRCNKIREQQHQINRGWKWGHLNITTTPSSSTPSYFPGDDLSSHPQPHAVVQEEEGGSSSHPQLSKPSFSTPTILM